MARLTLPPQYAAALRSTRVVVVIALAVFFGASLLASAPGAALGYLVVAVPLVIVLVWYEARLIKSAR